MYPVLLAEEGALESGKKLCGVAEPLVAAMELHADVVPCAGEDGVVALGTIDAEELIGLVVGIGAA